MISDDLSKDQEIFLSQKKDEKKARGIIFRGVKTRQCMSHVSMKNKTKHED